MKAEQKENVTLTSKQIKERRLFMLKGTAWILGTTAVLSSIITPLLIFLG